MLLAISVGYWRIIIIYCGMVFFLDFREKITSCACLVKRLNIWVKRHFPLIIPFTNFNDVSSANVFVKNSKLSGKLFMYTKKKKGPNIEPCGTPARIGYQLEG